ncbi:hypothetical protein VTO42DRAFT_9014 [Malbranchea cinnamomea]
MKLLTKEEEEAHYAMVLKYGTLGGVAGLAAGWVGLVAAARRWALIRNLTLPMKAFLVSSSGTAAAVIAADHGSQVFARQQQREKTFLSDRQAQLRSQELASMTTGERLINWAHQQKYKIIGLTWVASMIGSWVLVGRNPYLTGQQKIVQARVYAQGLTLGVLCATAAFEIHDQRKGRSVLDVVKAKENEQHRVAVKERYEGEDLWKDMVAAEEERMKERKEQ